MSEDLRELNQAELDSYTKRLSQYWEGIHDEAEFEVRHMGFARVSKPNFTMPSLDPKALTNMDLVAYAETHIRFQAWLNYAENTLAYVKSMLIGVKRQMDELANQLKVVYATTKNPMTGRVFSVDDRKLYAENNPRYIELLRDRTKLESMRELTESQFNSLSRDAALISRHIEIRKMDIEAHQRQNNMPGRGMYHHQ